MEILWDPPKRLANLDKHGLDFADLRQEFFEMAVLVPARDRRMAAIGRLDDGTITVIFFQLGREAIFSDLDAPGQCCRTELVA